MKLGRRLFLCVLGIAAALSASAEPAGNEASGYWLLSQASYRFESAMRAWERGHFGALLYNYRTDGPLSRQFAEIIESDPDLPRVPVSRHTECFECDAKGDCAATLRIRFADEPQARLRRYHLPRAQDWGLYSETELADTAQLRASLASCDRRFEAVIDDGRRAWEREVAQRSLDGFQQVAQSFEATLSAYRDERWEALLPRLAAAPREAVRKQLALPDGEQGLLATGRLPVRWALECVERVTPQEYQVLARMANRNNRGQMYPYRFTLLADGPGERGAGWLLDSAQELGGSEFDAALVACRGHFERLAAQAAGAAKARPR